MTETCNASPDTLGGGWPEKWSGSITVGNMIANLATLPADMPIHTAYHIIREDQPLILRVKRPTLSRERCDGLTIKTGDETVPYSAVIWAHPREPDTAPDQPAEKTPPINDCGEGEPVRVLRRVLECFGASDFMPSRDFLDAILDAERVLAALSNPAQALPDGEVS